MFFFQEIFTQNFHTQFYLHLNFIFQQNRKQKQQFFPNIFILIRPLLSELLAIGTTNWVYETQTKKAFFNAIDYDNCGAILQFPVSMKKDYTCFSFNKSYFVFQSFRKCIFYFPQQQKRREIRPDQKAKSNKSLFITYGNQKSETDLLPVPLHQRDHCFFIDDSTFVQYQKIQFKELARKYQSFLRLSNTTNKKHAVSDLNISKFIDKQHFFKNFYFAKMRKHFQCKQEKIFFKIIFDKNFFFVKQKKFKNSFLKYKKRNFFFKNFPFQIWKKSFYWKWFHQSSNF